MMCQTLNKKAAGIARLYGGGSTAESLPLISLCQPLCRGALAGQTKFEALIRISTSAAGALYIARYRGSRTRRTKGKVFRALRSPRATTRLTTSRLCKQQVPTNGSMYPAHKVGQVQNTNSSSVNASGDQSSKTRIGFIPEDLGADSMIKSHQGLAQNRAANESN